MTTIQRVTDEQEAQLAQRLSRELADAKLMMEKMARALRVYAREENWDKDDWGVPSVLQAEYGKPGTRARNTLKRYEAWKAVPRRSETTEGHS